MNEGSRFAAIRPITRSENLIMRFRAGHIATLLLVLGALTLAGGAFASTTKSSPPRTVKKAQKLVRGSATQLVRNYAKRRVKVVCNGLTAKARKSLGGSKRCRARVRALTASVRISKVKIKKVVLRNKRRSATVTGYLNGKRKERLVVVFKWEKGRYLLDHAVSKFRNLLR
jgi:hypothetical protein